MPFPSALSSGQIAQVRQSAQRFKQFLCAVPFEIVWQAQVDQNRIATNYADFLWTNESGSYGTYTDVKEGMVVYITTNAGSQESDFFNPVYRGRTRKTPSATTFYINENGINISTSMYVTVVRDWDVFERVQRTTDEGIFKDWDIEYDPPPPYVSDGLQSSYVDYTGDATVTIAFAPTVTPTTKGATISSYLWDVGDGTITVGSETTKDITVQFPGAATNEHRWVRLEFTDSEGVTGYFVFNVFTVDLDEAASSEVLRTLSSQGIPVSCNWQQGHSGRVIVQEDVSGLLPNTRVTLFSADNYGGTITPIVTNVMMVGRLRAEVVATDTDMTSARRSSVEFTIEGFGQQLGAIPAQPLAVIDQDTPSTFLHIEDPTPRRAIMYLLLWHTTYANVSAVQFDSDIDDYIDQNFKMDAASSMLEMVNQVARLVQAEMTFAASGESAVKRNANYIPIADRSGITVVMFYASIDRFRWQMESDYKERVGRVLVGATTYDSTLKTRTAFIGKAPTQGLGAGHEPARLDGQLLLADQEEIDSIDEVTALTAYHLAAINPKPILQVDMVDGNWWIHPVNWQFYRFDIEGADNVRGVDFDSSDNWLCTSVTNSQTPQGRRITNATFEYVSYGTNAGRYAGLVPSLVGDPVLPISSPYPADPSNPLVNYPENDPDYELPGLPTFQAIDPAEQYQDERQQVGCETLNVPVWKGVTVYTTNPTVGGETYLIHIEGDMYIGESWIHTFDFTSETGDDPHTTYGQGDWYGYGENAGQYTSGVGWKYKDARDPPGIGTYYRRANIRIDEAFVGTRAEVVFNYVKGTFDTADWAHYVGLSGVGYASTPHPLAVTGDNQSLIYTGTGSAAGSTAMITSSARTVAAYNGNLTIKKMILSGKGVNPWGSYGQRGDAFYMGYDVGKVALYGSGQGFLVNGVKPSDIPVFNANHIYIITKIGTGAKLGFKFADLDYTNNDRLNLVVTVCGPNMGSELIP